MLKTTVNPDKSRLFERSCVPSSNFNYNLENRNSGPLTSFESSAARSGEKRATAGLCPFITCRGVGNVADSGREGESFRLAVSIRSSVDQK